LSTPGRLAIGSFALLWMVAGAPAQVPVHAQESWDAVYLSGSKIGYIHTFIEKVSDRGRELHRVRVDTVLNFRRGNDVVENKLMYGTIETPDGQVLRLDTRTLASNREIQVKGDVIRGQMTLTLDGTGQKQSVTIPWGPDVRGPYAAEQSMARAPIQEGETRALRMFMPDLNKICDIQLKGGAIEEVTLGDGSKRPLRRIDQVTSLDGKPRPEFDLTLWVDAKGQVLKSEQDILGGMVTYRTTREGATAPNGPIAFDQIKETIVKVARKIRNPEQTRRIRYQVTMKTADPSQIFPVDRRQTIEPGASSTSMVLDVRSGGPSEGEPSPDAPGPAFLQPNGLITSEDPLVKRLAVRAIGNATDPWEKATRIHHWIFENLKRKNFETTFAPAGEVARSLSGDCTEHSVLAAAMCRSVGIPCRVAVGLIYVENLGGFGFHMWDEVFVNQRWVALDASWDQSTVDAVHIKLADTSLEGVSPFEAFLPIVRVQGKVEIEPIEIR
jgi:transglutaminase-like putative cysteine protease